MSYTKLNPQPVQRAADAQGISAPGLYPNEVAVKLDDTGALVAVFVEVTWQGTNAGAEFYASARAINADGSTMLCPAGSEVVTEARHLADPLSVQQFTAASLSKECVLAVLGEPPTLVDETGPDANGNPVTIQAPMIAWGDIARAQFSIRHALAMVADAGEVTDLGALLASSPAG